MGGETATLQTQLKAAQDAVAAANAGKESAVADLHAQVKATQDAATEQRAQVTSVAIVQEAASTPEQAAPTMPLPTVCLMAGSSEAEVAAKKEELVAVEGQLASVQCEVEVLKKGGGREDRKGKKKSSASGDAKRTQKEGELAELFKQKETLQSELSALMTVMAAAAPAPVGPVPSEVDNKAAAGGALAPRVMQDAVGMGPESEPLPGQVVVVAGLQAQLAEARFQLAQAQAQREEATMALEVQVG
jgi:hypothetical protein